MSGLLGKADLAADTAVNLYMVPTGKVATVNLNLCNRNTSAQTVRIAVYTGGTLTFADYLEYYATIPPRGVMERTGIAMSAGEWLWVWAEHGQVSVRAHGFEEDI